jgi:hypothetical protein
MYHVGEMWCQDGPIGAYGFLQMKEYTMNITGKCGLTTGINDHF